MEYVDAAGRRITYQRPGHGDPLLLLMVGSVTAGTGGHSSKALSDGFAVIAWDAPGCGGSSDPPQTWQLAGKSVPAAGRQVITEDE